MFNKRKLTLLTKSVQPVDKPHIPTGIWGKIFIKRKILEKQSKNADKTGYSTCVLHTF